MIILISSINPLIIRKLMVKKNNYKNNNIILYDKKCKF